MLPNFPKKQLFRSLFYLFSHQTHVPSQGIHYVRQTPQLGRRAIIRCRETKITEFTDVPGVRSEGDKFVLLFTCKVCEIRSSKYISKQAYYNGCVVVRCPGCKNMHLISDHTGIFEDPGWDIEKFLSEKGEKVKIFDEGNVLELCKEDLYGKSKSE